MTDRGTDDLATRAPSPVRLLPQRQQADEPVEYWPTPLAYQAQHRRRYWPIPPDDAA